MKTLPSSFSRFVSDDDLNRVRDEFLSALADLEAEDLEEDTTAADGPEPSLATDAGTTDAR